ncbi:MAG: aspartate 1-decarboxylase [Candidatus Cloacimonetes bacterium]|nr:aspartate 1-decarboxylase [Candidatus Cloacimonadota bacterium]
MLRQKLLAKLHRATVTLCDLNYNGSISIDEDLLDATGMQEFERVEIYNINNGARFSTYIIKAPRGSGEIGINGAAARKAQIGDKVIIINYGLMDEDEMKSQRPKIVVLDAKNKIKEIK